MWPSGKLPEHWGPKFRHVKPLYGFSASQEKTGCELKSARQGLFTTCHSVGSNSNFHVCETASGLPWGSWFTSTTKIPSWDNLCGVLWVQIPICGCVREKWGEEKDTCLCEASVTYAPKPCGNGGFLLSSGSGVPCDLWKDMTAGCVSGHSSRSMCVWGGDLVRSGVL